MSVESNVSENGAFILFLIGDPKGEVVFETMRSDGL